ncbi:uncharacterized protein M421DRAFT_66560 [Didymella exigua CBS 183.55]|uniref:LYR motif-containing protein Cup1-like N-terminal domain-containing protein n=1 Tax=Didymella exigua CBS 183.55 TaxID=1150837 RepID=A0A6A5RIL6_9PLEO|nr:uncharacterized protein M421DRAFT_66560 [Didymella exigua CBS 183.55]KAF1926938.1 hypothetical protein M421DRAFT_66560 [Didymella exigua CBS 183.55]
MPAPLHSPAHTRSLHLLRALLREATYLPDATARTYFRRYVVARFKAYQPRPNATASFDVAAVDKYRLRAFKRRHAGIIKARLGQQQRKAHKGLNFLRRANQGEAQCLQKALWFAYGRLGRRKHALLDDLLKPDPAWPAGPAPLQQLYRSELKCLQYFEAPQVRAGSHAIYISQQYPRLRALVTSQSKQATDKKRAVKSPFLTTPVLNTWQRPVPIKRAINNVRRWYADTMTALLPALPTEEWNRLEAMSNGQQRIGFVRPRTPAAGVPSQPGADDSSLERMVHHSLALDKLSKADRPQGINRPHNLTVRFMQRLYAKLLTLTPKLEYNETRQQWRAVWGQHFKAVQPRSYTAPVDDALFAGVDAKGIAPKAPKKKEFVPGAALPRNDNGKPMTFPFYAEWLPKTHPVRLELDKWKAERDAARAKWVAAGGDA